MSRPRKKADRLTSALVIGIGLNLMICLLLAFVGVRDSAPEPPPIQVLASAVPVEPDEPQKPRPTKQSLDSAPSAQAAPLSAVSAIQVSAVSPVVIPVMPDAIPDLRLTGTRLNSFGTAFSANVDPGKIQRGSGGGFGSLFGGLGAGNGEGIAVLVDISGSMKKHSATVSRLIAKRYPRFGKATVVGCTLNENSGPIQEIQKLVEDKPISVIVFICDLQDGVNQAGMLSLWNILNPEGRQVQLNIISFAKAPRPILADLLEQVGGGVFHGEETIENLITDIAQARHQR
ncbi:MAG: hypothetical protein ACI8UO_001652 [Verrucomicrobiales bacterium]|jgi:hypothetical protein